MFSIAIARYVPLDDPYFNWLLSLIPIGAAVAIVTVAIVFFGLRRSVNKRYVNLGLRGSEKGNQ